jgi:hypothetical protein
MQKFARLVKTRNTCPIHRDENIARLDVSLLCRRPCTDVYYENGTRLCAANKSDSRYKGRRALANSRAACEETNHQEADYFHAAILVFFERRGVRHFNAGPASKPLLGKESSFQRIR